MQIKIGREKEGKIPISMQGFRKSKRGHDTRACMLKTKREIKIHNGMPRKKERERKEKK